MDLQLEGKRCLVTGASQGIGRATAKMLAAEGCHVVLVGRRLEPLEAAADEIRSAGRGSALVVSQDVTTLDAPAKVRERVESDLGSVDILVNSAGGSRTIPWDAGEDVWVEGMELNFGATRRMTTEFLPGMRKAGFGRVINITGTSEPPWVNVASTAKGAVHAWAKGLSRVVAKDGITVNSIAPAPGIVRSEQILNKLFSSEQERDAYIAQNVPVGFMGEAEDLGFIAVCLASPLARFVTGDIIHADGGARRFAF